MGKQVRSKDFSPYFNVNSTDLSLPASLSEAEREEQRKNSVLKPLSVSGRGLERGSSESIELRFIF
jgi:hypothetical protein